MALPPLKVVLFVHSQETRFLTEWDWMETNPLGGSESSALHVARELTAIGLTVLVTNRVDDLRKPCDIFISTRIWQVFSKGIRPGKLNYLWCTDDADQPSVAGLADPAMAAKVYGNIDGAFLLSHYQAGRWRAQLNLPAEKIFLTRNGIPLARFSPDRGALRSRPRAAYYGSTPYRGLAAVIDSWPRIRGQVPDAVLHIFSSMQIYGVGDTPEFEALYQRARAEPGIEYHGAQGQATIRPVIQTCRALAYPCAFPETSCITAMEAMAAGCAVVGTALGALPETAAGNPLIPYKNVVWRGQWEAALVQVLADDSAYESLARANLDQSQNRDWSTVIREWIGRFGEDWARQVRR